MEKRSKKIILIILIVLLSLVLLVVSLFAYFISPVDKNGSEKDFIVQSGASYASIGTQLKSEKLIRNELFYKLYIKLNSSSDLEAGKYKLSSSMSLNEIISVFEKGAEESRSTKNITFVEGKNMRYYISTISQNFNISEEEILNKLSDNVYLDSLITKYWFLTDEIKNEKIFYSLEGYLYPDTYIFYEDSTIEEIFEKMLDNFNIKVTPYKEKIESSNYTFHELLTLASVVESEVSSTSDRKGVASVFYNRLKTGMPLGSDVTTYYAKKIEFGDRDLYLSEINECNDYNTRNNCMSGKLPVSPICGVSLDSLEASVEPSETDYFYFVADVNGVNYFNKTLKEHEKTIEKLKKEGKWFR